MFQNIQEKLEPEPGLELQTSISLAWCFRLREKNLNTAGIRTPGLQMFQSLQEKLEPELGFEPQTSISLAWCFKSQEITF